MEFNIVLDDRESRMEPIKIAQNLIELVNDKYLKTKDIKEIIAYLSVYTRYNP